jgi:hypothetical protein
MDEDFFSALKAALHSAKTLEAEVEDLEHERKRVLAKEIVAQGNISVAKAEEVARAGEAYGTFLATLKAKRQDMAKASADAEYLKTRWETWRSQQATKRAKEYQ